MQKVNTVKSPGNKPFGFLLKKLVGILVNRKLVFILVLVDQLSKILVSSLVKYPRRGSFFYFFYSLTDPWKYVKGFGFWVSLYYILIVGLVVLYAAKYRGGKVAKPLGSLVIAGFLTSLIDVMARNKIVHIFVIGGFESNLSDIYFNVFVVWILWLFFGEPAVREFIKEHRAAAFKWINCGLSIFITGGLVVLFHLHLVKGVLSQAEPIIIVLEGSITGYFSIQLLKFFFKKGEETGAAVEDRPRFRKDGPVLLTVLVILFIPVLVLTVGIFSKLNLEKRSEELGILLGGSDAKQLLEKGNRVKKSQFLREKPIFKDFVANNTSKILNDTQLNQISHALKYRPVIIEVPSNINTGLAVRQLCFSLLMRSHRVLAVDYENWNFNKGRKIAGLLKRSGYILILNGFPTGEEEAWGIFNWLGKGIICITTDRVKPDFLEEKAKDGQREKDREPEFKSIPGYIKKERLSLVQIRGDKLIERNRALINLFKKKKKERCTGKKGPFYFSPDLEKELEKYPFMLLYFIARNMYYQEDVCRFDSIGQVDGIIKKKIKSLLAAGKGIDEILFILALLNKETIFVREDFLEGQLKKYIPGQTKQNKNLDQIISFFTRNEKNYVSYYNLEVAKLFFDYMIRDENLAGKVKAAAAGIPFRDRWNDESYMRFIMKYLRQFPEEISEVIPVLFENEAQKRCWLSAPDRFHRVLALGLLHTSSFPGKFYRVYRTYARREALKKEIHDVLKHYSRQNLRVSKSLLNKESELFDFMKILEWVEKGYYRDFLESADVVYKWKDLLETYSYKGKTRVLRALRDIDFPGLDSIKRGLRKTALETPQKSFSNSDYFEYLETIRFVYDRVSARQWADFVHASCDWQLDFIRRLKLEGYGDTHTLYRLYLENLLKKGWKSKRGSLSVGLREIFHAGVLKDIKAGQLMEVAGKISKKYKREFIEALYKNRYPALDNLLAIMGVEFFKDSIEKGNWRWLEVLEKIGYRDMGALIKALDFNKLFKDLERSHQDSYVGKFLKVLKTYDPGRFGSFYRENLWWGDISFIRHFKPLPRDYLGSYAGLAPWQVARSLLALYRADYQGFDLLLMELDIQALLEKMYVNDKPGTFERTLQLLVILKEKKQWSPALLERFLELYQPRLSLEKLLQVNDYNLFYRVRQLDHSPAGKLFPGAREKKVLKKHWERVIKPGNVSHALRTLRLLKEFDPAYAGKMVTGYEWNFYVSLFRAKNNPRLYLFYQDAFAFLGELKELGYRDIGQLLDFALEHVDGNRFTDFVPNYLSLGGDRASILNLTPRFIYGKIESADPWTKTRFLNFLWKTGYFEFHPRNKRLLYLYFDNHPLLDFIYNHSEYRVFEEDLRVILAILANTDVSLYNQVVGTLEREIPKMAELEHWYSWKIVCLVLYDLTGSPRVFQSMAHTIREMMDKRQRWVIYNLSKGKNLAGKINRILPPPPRLAQYLMREYSQPQYIRTFLSELKKLKYNGLEQLTNTVELSFWLRVLRENKGGEIFRLLDTLKELGYPRYRELITRLAEAIPAVPSDLSPGSDWQLIRNFRVRLEQYRLEPGDGSGLQELFPIFKEILRRVTTDYFPFRDEFWDSLAGVKDDPGFTGFSLYLQKNLSSSDLLTMLYFHYPVFLKAAADLVDFPSVLPVEALVKELKGNCITAGGFASLFKNLAEIHYHDMDEVLTQIDPLPLIKNLEEERHVWDIIRALLKQDTKAAARFLSYLDDRWLAGFIFNLSDFRLTEPDHRVRLDPEKVKENTALVKKLARHFKNPSGVLAFAHSVIKRRPVEYPVKNRKRHFNRQIYTRHFFYFLYFLKHLDRRHADGYLATLAPSTAFYNIAEGSYYVKEDTFYFVKEIIFLLEELSYPRMKEYLTMYSPTYLSHHAKNSINRETERKRFKRILEKYLLPPKK